MAKVQKANVERDEDDMLGDRPARAGHNSSLSGKEIMSIIERIERITEEKKGLADDIKEIYLEAKGRGYDAKIIRQLIKMRKISEAGRKEQDLLLDTYMMAIGMDV